MINYYRDYRKRVNLNIIVILVVVIFLEWIEYSLTPWVKWPKFSTNNPDSVRLLLVADPQLLGNRNSGPNVLGFIYRWDSDRYVSKTFELAYDVFNPDLVIFLGDNLDEGEIATNEEFFEYFQRFKKVFRKVDFDKAIILPGDNDIGGEDEPPDPQNEARFNKYFTSDIFIQFRFLEFVKINYITHSNSYVGVPNITEPSLRVILSHVPLTPLYSSFISRVIPYVQPHLILSAHDHKCGYFIAERKMGILVPPAVPSESDTLSFNLTDSVVHEIMVPTCSYRMGTERMGYGALEIDRNGEVSYVVLWMPSRFRQLNVYLLLILFIVITLVLLPCKWCFCCCNNFNRR